MSAAIQAAAANTVFRVANLYEQNCALKHGLPKVGGPDRVDDPTEPADPPAPQPINITNNIPAAPAVDKPPSPGLGAAQSAPQASLLRRAAPFLATAAVGAGLPLFALWHPTSTSTPPAAITPPAINQPAPSNPDGDLLQWLQRDGRHLPEGVWPTK